MVQYSPTRKLLVATPSLVYQQGVVSRGAKISENFSEYGKSTPEKILHRAWRNAGLNQATVKGRDGHSYKITYGGKPAGSFGPDFTDAVIERDDGVVIRGDIEIHTRESAWNAHGHQKDRRYNGVVFHVVASESPGRTVFKTTGQRIPLLTLNWESDSYRSSRQTVTQPNRSTRQRLQVKPTLDLTTAGLERLHALAASISIDIKTLGSDQALWKHLLGALGYPYNKAAFWELSALVPWHLVHSLGSATHIENRLLDAAGFSEPRSNSDRRVPRWNKPWGRPANSPGTRIRAISAVVERIGGDKTLSGFFIDLTKMSVRTSDLIRSLSISLTSPKLATPAIGKARAKEIAVNVLLPFATALGLLNGDTALVSKARKTFVKFPKLSKNSLTTEAEVALSLDYTIPPITGACQQQGLIVLYREMTRSGIRSRQLRFEDS